MKKELKAEDFLVLWTRLKSLGLFFNLMAVATVVIIVFLILNLGVDGTQLALHYRVAQAKIEIFDAMSHTKPNAPSQKRYEFLARELSTFEPLESELEEKNFIWRKFSYSDKERLEFKERLFSSRQNFAKLAESRHAVFEKTAELPDFDQLLPSKSELPRLFMELELSEEIRKALIDSGASYVEEMNFPQAKAESFGKEADRYSYTHTAVFQTNWPGLLSFFRELAQSENLWHLDKVIIENKPVENAAFPAQNTAPSTAAAPGAAAPLPPDAPLHVNLVATGAFYGRKTAS